MFYWPYSGFGQADGVGTGWQFVANVQERTDLNSANQKAAGCYIASPKDVGKTISAIGLYVISITGSPPQYKISVQTGDSNGNPSGTLYGGGTALTATLLLNGNNYTLPNPQPVIAAAGDVFHTVVEAGGTPPDGSNWVRVSKSFSSGVEWWSLPCAEQMTAGTWDTPRQSDVPDIVPVFSDGTIMWPAAALVSQSGQPLVVAPKAKGAVFTIPFNSGVCVGAGFNLILETPHLGNFSVRLFSGTTQVRSTKVANGNIISNVGQSNLTPGFFYWQEGSYTVTSGQTLRVAVFAEDASGFRWNWATCVNQSAMNAITGDTDFTYSLTEYDGANWTDTALAFPMQPIGLAMTTIT